MPRSAFGSKREVRPGVWRVRVSAGVRADGTQRRRSATVEGTARDAEAAMARMAAEMGRSPEAGERMTLDDYFWGHFSPGRHASTTRANADNYDVIWRRHMGALGQMRVGEVDNLAVQRWVDGLPPQSAPAYVRCLRAVMNQAAFDHVISRDQNPMGPGYTYRMPRGRVSRPLPVWGAREVAACLDALEGDALYPLWLCMAGAGLSRSEALALDWEDVSWGEGPGGERLASVRVSRAYTAKDGMKEPKNARRYRDVPMRPPFSERLWACRRESGPLCAGARGGRMAPKQAPVRWRRLFAEGGRLEGLPFVQLGRMRATWSTLMQRAGVDPTVINAMQGRSEMSRVLYSNYLAPGADTYGEAAEAGARLVEGAGEGRPGVG